METRKVLIITYYWPPFGGSGVQRWLKFVKYLPQFGWEPVVFTPENPIFFNRDESLLEDIPPSVEIIKLPIWEPVNFFNKANRTLGQQQVSQSNLVTKNKKSLFQRISIWIRGNLFIPDGRVFWVKPAAKFLDDFVRSNKITHVVTTGPPHSMHLIGLKLKKSNPSIKWVADFRDPWTEWDLLENLSLTKLAWTIHRKKELDVLRTADRVVTIAPFHVKRLEAISSRKVDLITNGFDEADFQNLKLQKTEYFTIRHVGNVDDLRDPRPFMSALALCCESNPEFSERTKVEFIGDVNVEFQSEIRANKILSKITTFKPPVSHQEILELYQRTDLQLLILAHTSIAPGNLPGKFFEYMASGNPILALGPVKGDAGIILKGAEAGLIFEREDLPGIKEGLLFYFEAWQIQTTAKPNVGFSAYSRKNLTGQMVNLLNS